MMRMDFLTALRVTPQELDEWLSSTNVDDGPNYESHDRRWKTTATLPQLEYPKNDKDSRDDVLAISNISRRPGYHRRSSLDCPPAASGPLGRYFGIDETTTLLGAVSPAPVRHRGLDDAAPARGGGRLANDGRPGASEVAAASAPFGGRRLPSSGSAETCASDETVPAHNGFNRPLSTGDNPGYGDCAAPPMNTSLLSLRGGNATGRDCGGTGLRGVPPFHEIPLTGGPAGAGQFGRGLGLPRADGTPPVPRRGRGAPAPRGAERSLTSFLSAMERSRASRDRVGGCANNSGGGVGAMGATAGSRRALLGLLGRAGGGARFGAGRRASPTRADYQRPAPRHRPWYENGPRPEPVDHPGERRHNHGDIQAELQRIAREQMMEMECQSSS